MSTLHIKLRLPRAMQAHNLMPHKISTLLQPFRHRLTPKTRTPIEARKPSLEPRPRLHGAVLEPALRDLEPRHAAGVGGVAVVGRAARHPGQHRPDRVQPVHVDGGDILAGGDGDVGACGGARRVARERGVGGREDGVVGYPFALRHPGRGVLRDGVVVGRVPGFWCWCWLGRGRLLLTLLSHPLLLGKGR